MVRRRSGSALRRRQGGSIQDKASVEACNAAGIAMVFVGDRHFKH